MTNQEREGQEQWIEGWLELYDLTLHKKMEARLPEGLYIRGVVGPDQSFVPQSAILGGPLDNPPETGLRLGWLDLTTVKFHDVREAIGPHRPYVDGAMDASNHFYPDGRDISYPKPEQGEQGWLDLYNLSLHSDKEGYPKSLYIRGVVGPGQKFMPQSAIMGEALNNPPETGLRPGWLDLTTVKFHDVREKIGPSGPYINGKLDSSNHFYPDV